MLTASAMESGCVKCNGVLWCLSSVYFVGTGVKPQSAPSFCTPCVYLFGWCWQMFPPPHSLHWLLGRWSWQILLPPPSLHVLLMH
jgi:hypothetical protein